MITGRVTEVIWVLWSPRRVLSWACSSCGCGLASHPSPGQIITRRLRSTPVVLQLEAEWLTQVPGSNLPVNARHDLGLVRSTSAEDLPPPPQRVTSSLLPSSEWLPVG